MATTFVPLALIFLSLITLFLQCQARTLFSLMLDAKHDLTYAELFDPDTGRNGRIGEIKPFMQRYSRAAVGKGTVYYLYTHANYPQQVDFVSVDKMQICGSFRIEGTNNTNRMEAMHYDTELGIIGVFPRSNFIARVNMTGGVTPIIPFHMEVAEVVAESAYDEQGKRLFLLNACSDGYYIYTVDLRKGTVTKSKLPSPLERLESMAYDSYSGLLVGWYEYRFSVLNSDSGEVKSFGDVVIPSDASIEHSLFCMDNVKYNYYQVMHEGGNLLLYKINTSTSEYQTFPFAGRSVYTLDFVQQ